MVIMVQSKAFWRIDIDKGTRSSSRVSSLSLPLKYGPWRRDDLSGMGRPVIHGPAGVGVVSVEVWPVALFSMYRPKVLKVMSIVLVSNTVLGRECGGVKSDTNIVAMLKKNAADVPRTTSTSMVGDPWERDL